MDVPIVLLLLTALMGYLVAIDRALSQTKLIWFVVQACVFYILAIGLRSEKNIGRVVRLLVIGTLVLALIGLVGTDWRQVRLINLPGLYDRIPRLLSGLPSSGIDPDPNTFNPRRIGAAIAMLLPLSVVLLFFGRPRWDRLLALVTLLVGTVVLILSQAIMGLFGLSVALLLIGVWWRRRLLWVALAGLVALVAVIILYDPRQIALALLDINHPLGIAILLRLDIWSRSLAMIYDLPFTGIGLDNFPLLQTNFYIGHLLGPEPHAHNLILQTMNDLGIFGLLGLIWLLLAIFFTVFQGYRTTTSRHMQLLLLGLAGGILAFIAGGLLDSMALGDRPTLILWVMMGLSTAIAINARREAAATHNMWWDVATSRWLLFVPALLLLLALLFLPSARQRNVSLVMAHQAIYKARTTGELQADKAKATVSELNHALILDADNPELHGALASLYAWQGAEEASLNALRRRVALDKHDPLSRYAPFLKWRLQLTGEPLPGPSEGMLQIYKPWRNRFPDRAETYALTALVWQESMGNTERASSFLHAGLDKGAEPRELLLEYLNQIKTDG